MVQNHQIGLGEDFLTALDASYAANMKRPKSFQLQAKQFRGAQVARFPFAVFFQLFDAEIVVYSIFHTKRKPMSWQRRKHKK